MKTLENLILADWGPTMRGIAWALGHAVAIPAAVLIVLAQWLAFTWRRPLAGVLALVPVRRPDPIDAIGAAKTLSEVVGEILADVADDFDLTADELSRIPFHPASPNSPRSEPPAPMPPVLAPAPRRQRRRSNRPQVPA